MNTKHVARVTDQPAVHRLTSVTGAQIDQLAALLIDCVEGGASVSFMHPLPATKARAFWAGVADDVATGARALLVSEDASGIVGTVQLVLDQPENQPHRADVSKMLVHRRCRRHGLGAALMHAAEQVARDCDKSLLVLDTASPDAERLYSRLGWQACGVVPGTGMVRALDRMSTRGMLRSAMRLLCRAGAAQRSVGAITGASGTASAVSAVGSAGTRKSTSNVSAIVANIGSVNDGRQPTFRTPTTNRLGALKLR